MDSVVEFVIGVAAGVAASVLFVVAVVLERGDR